MLKSFVINKYISKDFLKIILIMIFGFYCLSTIMNLFEEINFFKDIEIGIFIPLFMSMLIVPSIIYNLLPFVILLSSIFLFWKLVKTDEVIALKTSGLSNLSIIIIPCIVAFFLGIFMVTTINPITSALVEKYENIKGSYNPDKGYLAAITSNGIWIKEQNEDITTFIRSSHLEKGHLMDVSIYQLDRNNEPILRMEAVSANIKNSTWILKGVRKYEKDENVSVNTEDTIIYKSVYDLNKIETLYSNLETISFWKLKKQIKLLADRGYSTKEMRGKLQKAISFPLFLVAMVLLAAVFTLGKTYKKNNWSYIFISIFACVLIYFFNDFSIALGKTEKLPIELSVWMPVIIVFIFSFIGLIHVNQK